MSKPPKWLDDQTFKIFERQLSPRDEWLLERFMSYQQTAELIRRFQLVVEKNKRDFPCELNLLIATIVDSLQPPSKWERMTASERKKHLLKISKVSKELIALIDALPNSTPEWPDFIHASWRIVDLDIAGLISDKTTYDEGTQALSKAVSVGEIGDPMGIDTQRALALLAFFAEDYSEIKEFGVYTNKPNSPGEAKIRFVRKMTDWFRARYKSKQIELVAMITSIVFDLDNFDDKSVSNILRKYEQQSPWLWFIRYLPRTK